MMKCREFLASLEAEISPLVDCRHHHHHCSMDALVSLIFLCREQRDRKLVFRLHSYLCRRGLEVYSSFGNQIISMMIDLGFIQYALQVFGKLVRPNELCWNSLIKGYSKCGSIDQAFFAYDLMLRDDIFVCPNGRTFLPLIKACIFAKDLKRGLPIHVQCVLSRWFERDHFVASAIVEMYAKCGWILEAQNVFDRLSIRDSVTWTVLIEGYVGCGYGEEALKIFMQMQLEGICPDAFTYVSTLKACESIRASNKAQQIHVEIENSGFLEGNVFLSCALVDMYAKCGLIGKAREVFDKASIRDVALWNALMTGYVEHHRDSEVLECFEKMASHVIPNAVTYICVLKTCISIGALDMGRALHSDIARRGILEHDRLVGSTIVDMYAKCGSLSKAHEVFDTLFVRDIVLWNTLVIGYVDSGYSDEALECYELMQLEGVLPDAITFTCTLKACGTIGDVHKAVEIHIEINRMGLLESNLVGNALIDVYGECGLLFKAQEVFDGLPLQDAVSWNVLIARYIQHGHTNKALQCLEHMQYEGISPDVVTFLCSLKACSDIGAIEKGEEIHVEIERQGLLYRDPFIGSTLIDMYAKSGLLVKAQEIFNKLTIRDQVSWNALITGYAEHGHSEQALEYFDKMKLTNCCPNAVTILCCMKACSTMGAIVKGQQIHAEIMKKGLLDEDLVVGNGLVDMYAKCGSLSVAKRVFDALLVRDIVSWNALISGYSILGECENVFNIFGRMQEEGIKPDLVSFIIVLNTCSRIGLFQKGQSYFEAMSKDYGIVPIIEHHICMVDALGRIGELNGALSMIKKMPFCPNIVTWHSMLNACRNWGNVDIGKEAFKHALCLDRNDSASYALMSHVYASSNNVNLPN